MSAASQLSSRLLPVPERVPVQSVHEELLSAQQLRLDIVRLDLLDPALGGNKWFKLRHNLLAARSAGVRSLLSFGGAWSNHLYALAEAGQRFGFETIGVIRGELPTEPDQLTPTLRYAISKGMRLLPVSRSDYRRRHDPAWQAALLAQVGPALVIPEGGANLAGVLGCQELAGLIARSAGKLTATELVLACGTATTMAGLLAGLHHQHLIADTTTVRGFAMLKGGDFLRLQVQQWLAAQHAQPDRQRWDVETRFHFGGYAKRPAALTEFVRTFRARHGIPVDEIYTGKLLAGLYQLIAEGHYRPGTRLLMLHTGGMQESVEVEKFPTQV
jgi:1-aminocyclopropane-1-carboxylate deaminase